MNIDEAVYGRRSVREYTAQSVDKATVAKLIEASTQAPSAMNEQPWVFTVVYD